MKPTTDYISLLWVEYCRHHGDKAGIRAVLKSLADLIVEDDDLGSALDVARLLYCAAGEDAPAAIEPVYHVHFNFDTDPYRLYCTHCGAECFIPVPLLMDDLMAVVRKFDRAHRDCQRPETAQ